MAVRMKGKEMMNHQHSKKDNRHSLTESHLKVIMTIIRNLTAITTQMVSIAMSDSLEGLGQRPAQPNHPKGSSMMQDASQTETNF